MASGLASVGVISLKDYDKLRGGFYTPAKIAEWLCNWAIRTPADTILEPSCGDGAFLSPAISRLQKLGAAPEAITKQILGIELIPKEAEKSRLACASILPYSKEIIDCGDFFAWALKNESIQYNCIIGNPPFIRYQNFPEPSRSLAMSILKRVGLSPNKLTNIWVPFVVASTRLLFPGGRLAFVLPAELLQVSYSAQLRSFLVEQFECIDIIACNQMIFDRAEQEIVLCLADGRKGRINESNHCLIDLWEAHSVEEILSSDPLSMDRKRERKIVNHDNEKWLKYFLTAKEISLMRELRESMATVELKVYGNVDVGVVTGRNEFFVLNKNEVRFYGIEAYTYPLIGRACQLKGSKIGQEEYLSLAEKGHRVFLFSSSSLENNGLSHEAKSYITYGEKRGFNKGYKCSIRFPWYSVPSIWNPDFFFFRQIYDFPRIVLNQIGATSTDTIHRLICNVDKNLFISNFYTHLTAASSEIEGRSYGGGVLELEPNEAERLLLPSKLRNGLPADEIDKLVREGKLQNVLLENDKKILIDGLGLSKRDCQTLQNIWMRMRNRRQSRKKSRKTL